MQQQQQQQQNLLRPEHRMAPATPGHFDELRAAVATSGNTMPDPMAGEAQETAAALAPHWARFFHHQVTDDLGSLDQRSDSLARQIRDNGVTYNVYADAGGPQRPWSLDLFPLLITPPQWQHIEAGVLQRVRLLERMMADIYGPQRLLARGLLPPALVHGHPGYLRAMHGVKPPGGTWLHIVAFDLARGPDGLWWLVSQRTQAPSGLGYLVENRIAVSRLFPRAFDHLKVQRQVATYRALMDNLRAQCPAGEDAHIVLLTPGPYNETYFEHAFLARRLGITLVEGGDMLVRDKHLYLKTLKGLVPVHVVLKRLDDQYLDPIELRADSRLGVPGLMQAIRAGNVLVANAPGSDLLESPALLGFLPALSRELLGEELRLPALPTWWCGERSAMDEVLPMLADCAIKPTYPGSALHGSFEAALGKDLSQRQLDEWAGRIVLQGDDHTIQAYVPLAQMPTWQRAGEADMAPNPGSARPPEGVQSFLGRPGEGLGPNPGSARPPEGVQSFLGRPGEGLGPNPGSARPPEGMQSFLGRPGEGLGANPGSARPPEGMQSFLGRPGEGLGPNPGSARPTEGMQSFLGRPGEGLGASGRIVPRSFMLRVFALADGTGSWRVLPGGLARVAGANAEIAAMQRGGSSADVWVMGEGSADTLRPAQTTWHTHVPTQRRQLVTSRAAENLFWLGRYTERSENTLTLARLVLESINGEDRSDRPLLAWLGAMAKALGLVLNDVPPLVQGRRVFERTLISCLDASASQTTSVGFNLRAIRQAAASVRERLSQEHWNLIQRVQQDFSQAMAEQSRTQEFSTHRTLEALKHASELMAAVTGAQTDRMARDDGWRLLSIGRHIERLSFLSSALALALETRALDSEAGFEAVLALFDSTISFHAQFQQARELGALLDLLVLDRDNPRSLAWIAHTLRGRLAKLEGSAPTELGALSLHVPDPAGWDVEQPSMFDTLAENETPAPRDTANLLELLQGCRQAAYDVSEIVSATYFTHSAPSAHSVVA